MENKQRLKVKVLHSIFKDSKKNSLFKYIHTKPRNFEEYGRIINRNNEVDKYIRSCMEKTTVELDRNAFKYTNEEEMNEIERWIELVNLNVDNNTIVEKDLQNVPNLLKKLGEV